MKRHIKKPSRAVSCDGKKTYSQQDAQASAEYVASKTGALMDAYRCGHGCTLLDGSQAWHIGHSLRSKR